MNEIESEGKTIEIDGMFYRLRYSTKIEGPVALVIKQINQENHNLAQIRGYKMSGFYVPGINNTICSLKQKDLKTNYL